MKDAVYKARPKKLTVAVKKSGKAEYDADFCLWINVQMDLLKKGEFDKLDIPHLIEEMEYLGNSERRALESYLEILLMHMLKQKYQEDKATRSWALSIKHSRLKAHRILKNNPSLKFKLHEIMGEAYESARLSAAQETHLPEKTFPKKCEWTVDEIL